MKPSKGLHQSIYIIDFLTMNLIQGSFDILTLVLGSVKNRRGILSTQRRTVRINEGPHNFDYLRVWNLFRKKINFEGFYMAPETMVGRIFFLSARVSYASSDDARYRTKASIRSPESSQSERGRLIINRIEFVIQRKK